MTRRTLLTATAAAALALAGGFAVGQLMLGSDPQPMRAMTSIASTRTASSQPTGPTSQSRVPADRSGIAAVGVAIEYLRALEPTTAGTQRPEPVQALTSGPLTAQALRAQASASLLARRILAEGPGFMRGWPLGYRFMSSGPGLVRLAVWTMGLVASRAEVVLPQWSTTLCTLQWLDGGWRVVAANTLSGPTPPAANSSPAVVNEFVSAASAFRGFNDGP